MSWPTPQDYNEALQNPKLAFSDPDLQAAVPDLTSLGLPKTITGNFASVYRVRQGSRSWGVRCFLRDFADHQERYAAIGAHLAAAGLPLTVGFHFLERGIRIRGAWYPALKMDWIEGSTLQEYISANHGRPLALASISRRWLDMIRRLQSAGIAHGDLQHGNILMVRDDFRLIDYDGMYVPQLSGRLSHEIGHRNYQHPARTEEDFGPALDNFSAWVIYLSLIAVSVEPSLWTRFGSDEERLIFQREDFDQPRFSRLMRTLEQVRDNRVQDGIAKLRSFLESRLDQIPSPASLTEGREARSRFRSSVAGWWADVVAPPGEPLPVTTAHINSNSAVYEAEVSVPHQEIDAPDHPGLTAGAPAADPVSVGSETTEQPTSESPPSVPPSIQGSFRLERRLTLGAGAGLLALAGAFSRDKLSAFALAASVAASIGSVMFLLTLRYLMLPEAQARLHLCLKIHGRNLALCRLVLSRGLLRTLRAVFLAVSRRIARRTAMKVAGVRRSLASRLVQLELELQSKRNRHDLGRCELLAAESGEILRELGLLQRQYTEYLQNNNDLAVVRGLPAEIKGQLRNNGIQTAQDISVVRIPPWRWRGAGQAVVKRSDGVILQIDRMRRRHAARLAAWRQDILHRIHEGPPAKLPEQQERTIRAAYSLQMDLAAARMKFEELDFEREKQVIGQRCNAAVDGIRRNARRRRARIALVSRRLTCRITLGNNEIAREWNGRSNLIWEMERLHDSRFRAYIRRVFGSAT